LYPATSGFINTLRFGSFIVAARLTLYQNGQSLAIILPVSVGSFTVDRNSAQRRQGELTIELIPSIPPQTISVLGVTQPYLPISPKSPLAPFGNEVFVELTVMADPSKPVGSNGWVPMGVYAIAGSTIDDSGQDMTVTLDLYDRSWIYSRWGLLSNYVIPAAGGNVEAEIKALLSYTWNNNGPGRAVAGSLAVPSYITNANFTPTTYVVPAGVYQQGQDPWAACLDMAASAGYELFFDINGVLAGKPAPGSAAGGTLSSLPIVWGFNPGEVSSQGTFKHPLGGTPFTSPVAASLQMTRDRIYNDYWVSATGPNNAVGSFSPVQAQFADTNPQSPTYVNGPIGDIPYFVYDATITGAGQALAEAQYDLAVSISTAQTVSVSTPLNPLFDIDDVCTMTNPRWAMTNQPFIVDTISVGIRYDAKMTLTGRMILPGS
jgi:hypothetical protein